MDWVVLLVRVPAEPSRHRVAVWRELRRGGALPIGAGAWTFPATALADETIDRVRELIDKAPDGELLLLTAQGRDEQSEGRLAEQYTAAREAEWGEFLADCGKFDAEIKREIAKKKLTLAELEEEEQSLDRLRRWHRELALRDVMGAPSAAQAAIALKESSSQMDHYTDLVYRALGQ